MFSVQYVFVCVRVCVVGFLHPSSEYGEAHISSLFLEKTNVSSFLLPWQPVQEPRPGRGPS